MTQNLVKTIYKSLGDLHDKIITADNLIDKFYTRLNYLLLLCLILLFILTTINQNYTISLVILSISVKVFKDQSGLDKKFRESEIVNISNLNITGLLSSFTDVKNVKKPMFVDPSNPNEIQNYYIKSSKVLNVNIVTLFNKIIDGTTHNNWKTHLYKAKIVKPSVYDYLYKYNEEELTLNNISFDYQIDLVKPNTVVFSEIKDNIVINLFYLEADSTWDKTRVTAFCAINNTLPFFYIESSFDILMNLQNYVNYTMINEICFSTAVVSKQTNEDINYNRENQQSMNI